MSHPLSIASRVHKFVGWQLVGTPDDLGIPNLKHLYEIPADRIRSEPLRNEDTAFLQKRAAGSALTRKITKRVGPLTTAAVIVLILIGFMCLALTVDTKKAIARAKVEQAQAASNATMCESMRANHLTPLPALCN
jgi:hypothetical protein